MTRLKYSYCIWFNKGTDYKERHFFHVENYYPFWIYTALGQKGLLIARRCSKIYRQWDMFFNVMDKLDSSKTMWKEHWRGKNFLLKKWMAIVTWTCLLLECNFPRKFCLLPIPIQGYCVLYHFKKGTDVSIEQYHLISWKKETSKCQWYFSSSNIIIQYLLTDCLYQEERWYWVRLYF